MKWNQAKCGLKRIFNMSEFNFKSQICTTREQSESLLALGLKKETADMCWTKMAAIRGTFYVPELAPINMVSWRHTPAWSLHRLIEMIQEVCSRIIMVHSWVRIENRCMPYMDYPCDSFDNTYDNLISCIEWLIKEGYFNKEYLV